MFMRASMLGSFVFASIVATGCGAAAHRASENHAAATAPDAAIVLQTDIQQNTTEQVFDLTTAGRYSHIGVVVGDFGASGKFHFCMGPKTVTLANDEGRTEQVTRDRGAVFRVEGGGSFNATKVRVTLDGQQNPFLDPAPTSCKLVVRAWNKDEFPTLASDESGPSTDVKQYFTSDTPVTLTHVSIEAYHQAPGSDLLEACDNFPTAKKLTMVRRFKDGTTFDDDFAEYDGKTGLWILEASGFPVTDIIGLKAQFDADAGGEQCTVEIKGDSLDYAAPPPQRQSATNGVVGGAPTTGGQILDANGR
jgi:hypothetical protein